MWVALLLFIALSFGSPVSYKGDHVVSLQLANSQQLHLLENVLKVTGDTDIWTHEGILTLGENHIRIKNSTLETLKQQFGAQVLIEDIQNLIENSPKSEEVGAYFDTYRRYAEIVAELKNLAARFPNLAKLTPSIGKSIEGRDIPSISISSRGFTNASIERIFFEGGQHAREWIAPTSVMYIITKLLENYGKDSEVTFLIDNVEFVIVPLVNPDGYEYTFTNDRLWRKNRRKNTGGSFGVDLNRNWDDHWCGTGSSKTPSSDTYCGTAPFSEPETKAVSTYVNALNLRKNVLGHIDFHAYGQLILRPYGWTTQNSPDNAALKVIGDGASSVIQKQSGMKYVSERACDLYITTGSSDDYFYGKGVWASYTIELRDTGRYGFVLPASQIIPTGEEIWAAVKYWSTSVYQNHP